MMEIKLGESPTPGQRWASVTFNGRTLFSELVYDNPENPAEKNITFLFVERLKKLLEEP